VKILKTKFQKFTIFKSNWGSMDFNLVKKSYFESPNKYLFKKLRVIILLIPVKKENDKLIEKLDKFEQKKSPKGHRRSL
jgi:hypothetical protein